MFLFHGWMVLAWGLFNGLAHWLTDFVSSRITKKLWELKDYHNFFVVIGLDQLCHYVVLFGSTVLLFT